LKCDVHYVPITANTLGLVQAALSYLLSYGL